MGSCLRVVPPTCSCGKSSMWFACHRGKEPEFVRPWHLQGEAKTRNVLTQIDAAVLCNRLALEDVPEQLVAHLHGSLRKVLGEGCRVAGHDEVVVVHLA